MFIVVDLIIVLIFALCILLGYKRGLAGCLIKVLAFFIALAISIVLFKPASAIVTSTTQIDENIQTSIVNVFEKEEENKDKDNVLCFIAIFIVARIILIFIKALADLITKLPIIKQCDKIGGVIYGILQAFVIVFIALALVTFISTMLNQYTVLEYVNQSYIGSILNSNNILLRIIF